MSLPDLGVQGKVALVAGVATALLLLALAAGCGDERKVGARALDERLIAAAFANDVETARVLIGEGADVNAKDESAQSAYLIATSEVGDDLRLLS